MLSSAKRMQGLDAPRVRLYQSLRSAHLERAHELLPAAIVYRDRRYDFDEDLVAGLQVIRASPLRAAWLLLRSRVDTLEINEPLMRSSVRGTALAVFSLRLRSLVGRHRASVVTYAIGNANPWQRRERRSVRARAGLALDAVLTLYLWRRLDRIAYGTPAAERTYRAVLPAEGRPESQVIIPALPCQCPCLAGAGEADPNRLVFLGAFAERKGFALLLEAWPVVRRTLPDARMTLIGKGPLLDRAEDAVRSDPTIDLIVDPPRHQIHSSLAGCTVLALPSQPTPTWREQVGLPIVEGLAHGCATVTTTETGLADWLAARGHHIAAAPTSPVELAAAIVSAFRTGPHRQDVLASLPATDGRLDADAWLFRDQVTVNSRAHLG